MAINGNDPRKTRVQQPRVQTIPEPDEDNVMETLVAMKEAIETLAQLRGNIDTRAITFKDLQDLNIVEILPNGAIKNKRPFGDALSAPNTLGMLKWCDGVNEDFGKGIGWYYLGSDGTWMHITDEVA